MVPVPPSLILLPLSADWIGSRNCPNFLGFTDLFLTWVIFPVHLPKQLRLQERARWLEATGAAGRKAPLAVPKVRSVTVLWSPVFLIQRNASRAEMRSWISVGKSPSHVCLSAGCSASCFMAVRRWQGTVFKEV